MTATPRPLTDDDEALLDAARDEVRRLLPYLQQAASEHRRVDVILRIDALKVARRARFTVE